MTSSTKTKRSKTPLFAPGTLVATPGALETLHRYQADTTLLLWRHITGDWGEVDAEDARANDAALREGTRVLSAYVLTPPPHTDMDSAKVWVITEADRSVTTILLPEEY